MLFEEPLIASVSCLAVWCPGCFWQCVANGIMDRTIPLNQEKICSQGVLLNKEGNLFQCFIRCLTNVNHTWSTTMSCIF